MVALTVYGQLIFEGIPSYSVRVIQSVGGEHDKALPGIYLLVPPKVIQHDGIIQTKN